MRPGGGIVRVWRGKSVALGIYRKTACFSEVVDQLASRGSQEERREASRCVEWYIFAFRVDKTL